MTTTTTIRLLLASSLAATSAWAHCQLAWPYPLHSSLNPATPESIKDYSMTSPLVTDGTYPCKGFINNPSSGMDSVVTWDAGATINYTIAGTATHGGGSCQLSMSYDSGATWNVIFSYMGGCLIEGMTESITIPADAPSGEALFAWGWFNLQGNREMYHNCAVVTITNGGDGFNDDDYPTPFVANAGSDVNDCVTVENTAVVFPNPGKNVKYGGAYATSQPTTPAGFTGSNCVGPGATSSSSSNSTSSSSTSSYGSSSAVAGASSSAAASAASTSAPAASNTASNTLSAASSHTTLWSVSLDESSTTLTDDVSSSPSSSSSASAIVAAASSTSTGKTCKKSKRSRRSQTPPDRRHERLIPRAAPAAEERAGGRIAAMPAIHNVKRDGKRVAASKATHNANVEAKRAGGRVAAGKAEHLTLELAREETKRAQGRKAANRASHVERRRQGLRDVFKAFHS